MVRGFSSGVGVSPPMLADAPMVVDALPRLVQQQVRRVIQRTQEEGVTPDWSTLEVRMQKQPAGHYSVIALLKEAE